MLQSSCSRARGSRQGWGRLVRLPESLTSRAARSTAASPPLQRAWYGLGIMIMLLFSTPAPSLHLNSHRAGAACDLWGSALQIRPGAEYILLGRSQAPPRSKGMEKERCTMQAKFVHKALPPWFGVGFGFFFAMNIFLSNSEGDPSEHIPRCSGGTEWISKLGLGCHGQLGMWISISTTLAVLSRGDFSTGERCSD